jgi:hypothetical protein
MLEQQHQHQLAIANEEENYTREGITVTLEEWLVHLKNGGILLTETKKLFKHLENKDLLLEFVEMMKSILPACFDAIRGYQQDKQSCRRILLDHFKKCTILSIIFTF